MEAALTTRMNPEVAAKGREKTQKGARQARSVWSRPDLRPVVLSGGNLNSCDGAISMLELFFALASEKGTPAYCFSVCRVNLSRRNMGDFMKSGNDEYVVEILSPSEYKKAYVSYSKEWSVGTSEWKESVRGLACVLSRFGAGGIEGAGSSDGWDFSISDDDEFSGQAVIGVAVSSEVLLRHSVVMTVQQFLRTLTRHYLVEMDVGIEPFERIPYGVFTITKDRVFMESAYGHLSREIG